MAHANASPSSDPAAARARSRWWKWPLRILFGLLGGLLLLASPLACTTTVIPPATPKDRVTVFLLDHSHTPSLVLPAGTEGMTRYAYGDWNYYALANKGFGNAVIALCWPTQGTLGRQELSGPFEAENVLDRAGVYVKQVYEVQVEREAARRLHRRLEAIYHENAESRVVNEESHMVFVPHPDDYTYFHNSNHVVADWLAELGCEVRGPAFYSRWRIDREDAAQASEWSPQAQALACGYAGAAGGDRNRLYRFASSAFWGVNGTCRGRSALACAACSRGVEHAARGSDQ